MRRPPASSRSHRGGVEAWSHVCEHTIGELLDDDGVRVRRAAQAARGPAQIPPVIHDTAGQQQTPLVGQQSISVGHEDLLESSECGNPLRYRRSSPANSRHAVHNLPESYN
jgi:hypothetical protein